MIARTSDLLLRLFALGYDDLSRDPWWWPHSGSFETLIGAILTQNTSWSNVELSLAHLSEEGRLDFDSFCTLSQAELESLIRPSGYYRNKARNLVELSGMIEKDFDTFECFQADVSRDWLMARRGIGNETADAILNYTCYREAFVVDSYTARLLEALGYPQADYFQVQRWMTEGVEDGCHAIFPDLSIAQCYARYHGMVVGYGKVNRKGREILTAPLQSI